MQTDNGLELTMTSSQGHTTEIDMQSPLSKWTIISLFVLNSTLRLFSATTAQVVLFAPTNNATDIGLQPALVWKSGANATAYQYELYQGAALVTAGSISGNASANVSAL